MPSRMTKEQRAEYQRLYRERKAREKAELAARATTPAIVGRAKAMQQAVNDIGAGKPDVHAACDEKIAELEAEVRRLNGLRAVTPEERRYRTPEEFVAEVGSATLAALPDVKPKPGFLAAPDDDCKTCTHDRHSYGHTNGPCQKPISRNVKCLCNDYDLGFE